MLQKYYFQWELDAINHHTSGGLSLKDPSPMQSGILKRRKRPGTQKCSQAHLLDRLFYLSYLSGWVVLFFTYNIGF